VYRGEIDGVYGREVSASVVAVHKLAGVERTDVWGRADWGLDLDHSAILERHPDEPDRIEVDITRQVLFIIRDGEIAAILPVSSGNGEVYWSRGSGGRYVRASTPRGDFTLFKHIDGWRHNYLGALYKPWYFTPYYAIHGSSSVPAYPASHGCVRVPNWEADNLDGLLRLGLPVHTWDA
jgi:lipoprotein-anchoring transpeptidase ErfK/SrfK